VTQAKDELLLLTTGGYGRRLPASLVPVPPKANSRGRVLVSRRPLAGFVKVGPDRRAWAISDRRRIALAPERLPLDESGTTRSTRLAKLAKNEEIRFTFSVCSAG